MLQQTTVAAVKDYFTRFLHCWPTLADLAAAPQDEVMAAWAGLGYYSRARNLKACAERIVTDFDGHFPQTSEDLRKLPGIGDYTSAAIAAIAFDEAAPVVDGNVERVVSRYLADPTPPPKLKAACRTFMAAETPANRPGDFAQAMMDLGATICTPRNPACALCPVRDGCKAFATGAMTDFPAKAQKKSKPYRKGSVFLIERHDRCVWLVRRPEKGLLGGMAGLPTTDWNSRRDGAVGADAAPFTGKWEFAGRVNHTFTHFHLELEVWKTQANQSVDDGWWCPFDALPQQALPTVMKKAITLVYPDAFRR